VKAGACGGGESVLGGEPAGGVAGGEPFPGEDVGGDLAGRQAKHPAFGLALAAVVGVGPCLGEGADHERLPGAGRPDQGLHPRAGGQHATDGGGLVNAQLDAGLA